MSETTSTGPDDATGRTDDATGPTDPEAHGGPRLSELVDDADDADDADDTDDGRPDEDAPEASSRR